MKLHGMQLLQDFTNRHPFTRSWVQAWVAEVEDATWSIPQDIKNRYRTVSFVGKHVIFNVKGNDYRMATLVAYQMGIVVVRWIGTHNDYMKIN
jgi:mRNA interferase HigB